MKFIKLSKTSWLILSTGIFVVVLAGLGITRSQQIQEQGKLEDELIISQKSLEKSQITDLAQNLEARKRLDQTVVSVDVTDEFFSIAKYCDVVVMNMNTTPIHPNTYEGIGLSATELNATAEGGLTELVNFVMSLNNDFTTGLVKSFQINIPPSSSNETPSASVQMIVYSYEG